MPAQESIPISATILGLAGTVCWCVQLMPQIWRNYRVKNTDGLPAAMLMFWAISAVPFGVYAILQNLNIPIQVQPQVFGALSLITWAQCLHYANGWRAWTSSLFALVLGILFGGAEAALIITLRPVYTRGTEYPVTIVGIIAAVLLAAGLLPPYFEIWRNRGQVMGFSFLFLTTDWMGAFLSLMSLVAQNTFDYIGGVLYIVCLVLETGIFACQGIWLLRSGEWRNLKLWPDWARCGGKRGVKSDRHENSTASFEDNVDTKTKTTGPAPDLALGNPSRTQQPSKDGIDMV